MWMNLGLRIDLQNSESTVRPHHQNRLEGGLKRLTAKSGRR